MEELGTAELGMEEWKGMRESRTFVSTTLGSGGLLIDLRR